MMSAVRHHCAIRTHADDRQHRTITQAPIHLGGMTVADLERILKQSLELILVELEAAWFYLATIIDNGPMCSRERINVQRPKMTKLLYACLPMQVSKRP